MSAQGDDRLEIIDSHCHVASEEHFPRSFLEGVVGNILSGLKAQGVGVTPKQLLDMYLRRLQDPLCDELVAEMDEAGISKAILLIPDFTVALKDCKLTIEESFSRHREVLARHSSRFEVFGGVDPRWGDDGVRLFERSLVEFGFRGFKVYPPCGFSPSSPELFPFYELCAQHRAPVLLHIGPTSPALAFDTCNPFLIDEAARRFPTVPFILAHGAVSFVEECAMLCRFRPNVYLDISGFQLTLGWDADCTAVRRLVSQDITHKVLFGTDWPVFRLQGTQSSFLDRLSGESGALSDLSDSAKALVLHKNFRRLMG